LPDVVWREPVVEYEDVLVGERDIHAIVSPCRWPSCGPRPSSSVAQDAIMAQSWTRRPIAQAGQCPEHANSL